jgi:hypothetical protein
MESLRNYLAIVREKGLAWQINVAWKVVALVAVLSFAAHAAYEKSFDRKGLAQLAAKGGVATTKERPRRTEPTR